MKKTSQIPIKKCVRIRSTILFRIVSALVAVFLVSCADRSSFRTQTAADASINTQITTDTPINTQETEKSATPTNVIPNEQPWNDIPLKNPIVLTEDEGNGIVRLILPESAHYRTTVKEIYQFICDAFSGPDARAGGIRDNTEFMIKLWKEQASISFQPEPILPTALQDGITFSGSDRKSIIGKYAYCESHFVDRHGKEILTVRQAPSMDMIDCYYGNPDYDYTYYTFETALTDGIIAEFPIGSPAAQDASASTVLVFDDGIYNFRLSSSQLSKNDLIAAADSMGRCHRKTGNGGFGAGTLPGGKYTECPVGYTYLYTDTFLHYTLSYRPEADRRIAAFTIYCRQLTEEPQYPKIPGVCGTLTPSGSILYEKDDSMIVFRRSGLSQSVNIFYGNGVSFFKTTVGANDALIYLCEKDGQQQEIGLFWSDGQSDYQLVAHSAELSIEELCGYAESMGTGAPPSAVKSGVPKNEYHGKWKNEELNGGFELLDLGDCYLIEQFLSSHQPYLTKNKLLNVSVVPADVSAAPLLQDEQMYYYDENPVYLGCTYYWLVIPKSTFVSDTTIKMSFYSKNSDQHSVMKTSLQYDDTTGNFVIVE